MFVYVKTGKTELTLGPTFNWTNPKIYHILAGLCCASIDQELRGEDLVQYICTGSVLMGTPGAIVNEDSDPEDDSELVGGNAWDTDAGDGFDDDDDDDDDVEDKDEDGDED